MGHTRPAAAPVGGRRGRRGRPWGRAGERGPAGGGAAGALRGGRGFPALPAPPADNGGARARPTVPGRARPHQGLSRGGGERRGSRPGQRPEVRAQRLSAFPFRSRRGDVTERGGAKAGGRGRRPPAARGAAAPPGGRRRAGQGRALAGREGSALRGAGAAGAAGVALRDPDVPRSPTPHREVSPAGAL